MPAEYVMDMLRNVYRRERAKDRWRMAFNRIRNAFTLPGPDRRRVARISRGLPFNHLSRAWKNVVPRPRPVLTIERPPPIQLDVAGYGHPWLGFDRWKAHSNLDSHYHLVEDPIIGEQWEAFVRKLR